VRPLSTVRPKSADSGPPHQLECPLHPGLSTSSLGVCLCLVRRAFAPSYGYGLLPLRQLFVCRSVDPFFEPPDSGVSALGAFQHRSLLSPRSLCPFAPAALSFRGPSDKVCPRRQKSQGLVFTVVVLTSLSRSPSLSPRPSSALQLSSSSATYSARNGFHPCPYSPLRPVSSCLTRARPRVLPYGWNLPQCFFSVPPLRFLPSVSAPVPVRKPSPSLPLPCSPLRCFSFSLQGAGSSSSDPTFPLLLFPGPEEPFFFRRFILRREFPSTSPKASPLSSLRKVPSPVPL